MFHPEPSRVDDPEDESLRETWMTGILDSSEQPPGPSEGIADPPVGPNPFGFSQPIYDYQSNFTPSAQACNSVPLESQPPYIEDQIPPGNYLPLGDTGYGSDESVGMGQLGYGHEFESSQASSGLASRYSRIPLNNAAHSVPPQNRYNPSALLQQVPQQRPCYDGGPKRSRRNAADDLSQGNVRSKRHKPIRGPQEIYLKQSQKKVLRRFLKVFYENRNRLITHSDITSIASISDLSQAQFRHWLEDEGFLSTLGGELPIDLQNHNPLLGPPSDYEMGARNKSRRTPIHRNPPAASRYPTAVASRRLEPPAQGPMSYVPFSAQPESPSLPYRFNQVSRNPILGLEIEPEPSEHSLSSPQWSGASAGARPPVSCEPRVIMMVENIIRRAWEKRCKPEDGRRGENTGRFQCTTKCGCRTDKSTDWKRHEEIRRPQKFYICPKCRQKEGKQPYVFSRKDKIRPHLKRVHGLSDETKIKVLVSESKVPYKPSFSGVCGFCKKIFDDWGARNEHVIAHFKNGALIENWNENRDVSNDDIDSDSNDDSDSDSDPDGSEYRDDDTGGPSSGNTDEAKGPPNPDWHQNGNGEPDSGYRGCGYGSFPFTYNFGLSSHSALQKQEWPRTFDEDKANFNIDANRQLPQAIQKPAPGSTSTDQLAFRPRLHYKGDLGRGTYGVVHKVQDVQTQRVFALKTVCMPTTMRSQTTPPNEFNIMAILDHRNVVKLVSTLSSGGFFGALMEPAAETNLKNFLSSQTLNQGGIGQAKGWFDSLASAVSYINSEGIRHADIKPQNILIHDGDVLISDFGASRYVSRTDSESSSIGPCTPMYCAPEIAARTKHGRNADVYSLGCVYLELLTVLSGLAVQSLWKLMKESASHGKLGSTYQANPTETKVWLQKLAHSFLGFQMLHVLSACSTMLRRDRKMRPCSEDVVKMLSNMRISLDKDTPTGCEKGQRSNNIRCGRRKARSASFDQLALPNGPTFDLEPTTISRAKKSVKRPKRDEVLSCTSLSEPCHYSSDAEPWVEVIRPNQIFLKPFYMARAEHIRQKNSWIFPRLTARTTSSSALERPAGKSKLDSSVRQPTCVNHEKASSSNKEKAPKREFEGIGSWVFVTEEPIPHDESEDVLSQTKIDIHFSVAERVLDEQGSGRQEEPAKRFIEEARRTLYERICGPLGRYCNEWWKPSECTSSLPISPSVATAAGPNTKKRELNTGDTISITDTSTNTGTKRSLRRRYDHVCKRRRRNRERTTHSAPPLPSAIPGLFQNDFPNPQVDPQLYTQPIRPIVPQEQLRSSHGWNPSSIQDPNQPFTLSPFSGNNSNIRTEPTYLPRNFDVTTELFPATTTTGYRFEYSQADEFTVHSSPGGGNNNLL